MYITMHITDIDRCMHVCLHVQVYMRVCIVHMCVMSVYIFVSIYVYMSRPCCSSLGPRVPSFLLLNQPIV